jgi:hypothetical protein
MDEADVEKAVSGDTLEFRVRALRKELDEGDRSRFVEITLPRFRIVVTLKKTDYAIPEMGVAVKSRGFRITNVGRGNVPAQAPAGTAVHRADYRKMRDYLFRTRNEKTFPSERLSKRIGDAIRSHLEGRRASSGEHVIYVAPLSPVANEVWAYWETERRLLRVASDVDLENEAVWEHEALAVRLFDVDQQVVVSLSEVPGSNAYLTRDQVGRALYNCVILGQKRTVQVDQAAAD